MRLPLILKKSDIAIPDMPLLDIAKNKDFMGVSERTYRRVKAEWDKMLSEG